MSRSFPLLLAAVLLAGSALAAGAVERHPAGDELPMPNARKTGKAPAHIQHSRKRSMGGPQDFSGGNGQVLTRGKKF